MADETNPRAGTTIVPVLLALSVSHLLNDAIQSLLPAVYPILKASFHLSFAQIGMITLAFQLTASLLQPAVGFYTDRQPRPFSLAVGMCCTLVGLILLSRAANYHLILLAAAMVGLGSSVFHPEASRMAKAASGGRHGLAQSVFQVGGNFGTSLGPLLAAAIIVPRGQHSILWFTLGALLGIFILLRVGSWYQAGLRSGALRGLAAQSWRHPHLSAAKVGWSVFVLLVLIFSKFFYLASLTNYYTFYLIAKFHLPVSSSEVCLFVFLFAVAAGTIIGGPVGDRIGRKLVIWVSILGVAPFSLVLPHLGIGATILFTVFIGIILASAMPAILVYAQELIPGKPGTVAGLFFGFAFGMAGVASAVLGKLADHTSIFFVFEICSYLPLLGLLTAFLPDLKEFDRERKAA